MWFRRWLSAVLVVGLLSATSGAEEEGPQQKIPSHKLLLISGVVVGGIVSAMLLDHPIQEDLFPDRNNDPSEDLRLLGDKGQLAGPALGTAFLLYGFPAKSSYAKTTGALLFGSYALTGITVGGIKFVVGRSRPSKTSDADHYDPGSGDGSFPSGHTAVAFSAATVIAERYPKWYIAVPAYAAATGVGFSRMYANKHWLSDVVAGGALGWGVSHWLNKRFNPKEQPKSAWMFDGEELRYVRWF